MENTGKDQWIDKALHSLEGMQRADPDPYVFSRIMQKINSGKTATLTMVGYIPVRWISMAAAALGLLFVLNFFALKKHIPHDSNVAGMEAVLASYQITDNNFFDKL